MLICRTIKEIREFTRQARKNAQTVALVPTMGYFHDGHLALMREAKKTCDLVIVSIFVNPLQFGRGEDFNEYPRDFERDQELARKERVDAIFVPSAEEMYPYGFSTSVEVNQLTQCLCGISRPLHFRGVTTVVAKLFNIVLPEKAFFGQKDAQQVLVVKRMVIDLNMPLEIITVPTIREPDGLAMSSRNVYLDPKERAAALVLWRSLKLAEQLVADGEREVVKLQRIVQGEIENEPLAKIDYVEIRSLPNLGQVSYLQEPALLALAVRIGKVRLIDNTVLDPEGIGHVFNNV